MHAMWFVRIASFSVIWFTLTRVIPYVLTGWYVDALLRLANAWSVLIRTICNSPAECIADEPADEVDRLAAELGLQKPEKGGPCCLTKMVPV